MEVWEDIKGYEGLYQISNLGRVKSLERTKGNGKFYKEKFLKTWAIRSGYVYVRLCKCGRTKTFRLHRLVLETFNPVENMENLQANHKDENKSNNNLENLSWLSAKENCNYGTRNTRQALAKSKPIYCDELCKVFPSISQASRVLSVSTGDIWRCIQKKRKTAGGYHWRYYEKETN